MCKNIKAGGRRPKGRGRVSFPDCSNLALNVGQEETAREFLLIDFRDLTAQDIDVEVLREPRALLDELLEVKQSDQ